jgi:hypothetical protein
MDRYYLTMEHGDGPGCEWDTFLAGTECDNQFEFAVVDTGEDGKDDFHWAHGCDDHALRMLTIANEEAT